MNDSSQQAVLARWRLVLGKFAQPKMPDCLSGSQQRMADALESLYSREYLRAARMNPAGRLSSDRAGELFRLLRDSGLSELTDPFAGKHPAADLLRAGYVLSLHRQAARAISTG